MKKLFQFIKNLFVKLDVLEEKVEKAVESSKLLSAEQKAKIKKGLSDFDKFEENIEDVVDESEIAAEKIKKAVKSKNLTDVTAAVESVKKVGKEAKEVGDDAKAVAKKAKEAKAKMIAKKSKK
jgi:hypothetical protein